MKNNFINLEKLRQLVKQLRESETGCPWLREQTLANMVALTIEESYELADSISKNDHPAVVDEISDLLFHLMVYVQMGEETKTFDLELLAKMALDKQLRRKPEFENLRDATAEEALAKWEANKRKERTLQNPNYSAIDNVPTTLPGLNRALKLQQKAAQVGFDWQDAAPIFAKLDEEIAEIKDALTHTDNTQVKVMEEVGDLLFTCVNLARQLEIDPETALRQANQKFEARFRLMEQTIKASGKSLEDVSLAQMDAVWDAIKHQ